MPLLPAKTRVTDLAALSATTLTETRVGLFAGVFSDIVRISFVGSGHRPGAVPAVAGALTWLVGSGTGAPRCGGPREWVRREHQMSTLEHKTGQSQRITTDVISQVRAGARL